MIEPLTDEGLEELKEWASSVNNHTGPKGNAMKTIDSLIATIDALKESKQAILNMLGRMTADYDELEEENEKLKEERDKFKEWWDVADLENANLKEENKKLKGDLKIRVLSQSENATRISIEAFKEEIVELKDKIDNLKAEGYFE